MRDRPRQTRTPPLLLPTPETGIGGSRAAGVERARGECRSAARQLPDPTGNGRPCNGDYVLLGGAERRPPPPPTTRPRDLIPAPSPHSGRDKATEAALTIIRPPRSGRQPGPGAPKRGGIRHQRPRGPVPPSGAARRPLLLPKQEAPSPRQPHYTAHPAGTCLVAPRSLQYPNANCG